MFYGRLSYTNLFLACKRNNSTKWTLQPEEDIPTILYKIQLKSRKFKRWHDQFEFDGKKQTVIPRYSAKNGQIWFNCFLRIAQCTCTITAVGGDHHEPSATHMFLFAEVIVVVWISGKVYCSKFYSAQTCFLESPFSMCDHFSEQLPMIQSLSQTQARQKTGYKYNRESNWSIQIKFIAFSVSHCSSFVKVIRPFEWDWFDAVYCC